MSEETPRTKINRNERQPERAVGCETLRPDEEGAEAKTAAVPRARTGASRRTRAGGQDERRRERSAAAAA